MNKFFTWRLNRKAKIKQINLDFVDKKVSFWKPLLMILPGIIVMTFFIIIPFMMAARDSVSYYPNPHKPAVINYGLNTLKKLLADDDFKMGVQNTVIYALISVPILISVSAVISAVISSFIRKRLRGFWQTVFFIPYVTSAIAISLAFAYIFDQDHGIINAITGKKTPWLVDSVGHKALVPMLFIGIWKGMAFNILIFTTTMLGVNKNLYKSASIDGASGTKQFFKITLPSIKRSTSFLVFMAIIGATKIFPLALFQNNADEAVTNHGTTLMLYVFYQLKRPHGVFLAGAGSLALVFISISLTIIFRTGVTNVIKLCSFLNEKRMIKKTRRWHV